MIDYELIAAREAIGQTAAAIADVQANHIAIYLTMLFAYISSAYLAGDKFNRLQLSIITFVFVAAAGREVVIIAVAGTLLRTKVAQVREVWEQAPAPAVIAGAGESIWWPIAIWSTGIIAALLFMWSARRHKKE